MGRETDNWEREEQHYYIKEKIKKKPVDKKRIFQKIISIAAGGLLFGCSAAAAWVGFLPVFQKQFGRDNVQKTNIEIAVNDSHTEETSRSDMQTESIYPTEVQKQRGNLLDIYENFYSLILDISSEPRRALVTVKGISDHEDLLDNSYLSRSSSEGLIFLETDQLLYILTYEDNLDAANKIQVVFSDSSKASGHLCGEDVQSGIAVITVKKAEIRQKTLAAISVADLGSDFDRQQTKPVIAIGSPAGDRDAVMYGMVTSSSEVLPAADAEYHILATDIQGSSEGSGILLDYSGNAVGIIIKQDMEESNTVRALMISQLRPLIERLSNEQYSMYAGIHGITITETQSDSLQIPLGIYVDSVEDHSPAMTAGIQSGDIICAMDGVEITDMWEYYERLQDKKAGGTAQLIVLRKGSDGKYAEIEFGITIEEK